jgi:two-component system, response regulator YesN
MYKILIVDDEIWIRKGIRSKLDYLGFTFAWVGEAENGEEALDMIRKEGPHIVVTDIRMPLIGGIELIRAARNEGFRVKFVIISGYAEFEYAEQALNMGVSGYLLKPVTDRMLKDTFQELMIQLGREHDLDSVRKKTESLEKDNKRLLLEQAVNLVFHTPEAVAGMTFEEQEPLPVFDPYLKHNLILIHIDSSNYYESTFKYQDLGLLKYAIKNMLEELGANEQLTVINNIKDITQIFVILSHKEEECLRKRSDRYAIDIFTKINKYLKVSVTIAVSGIESRLSSEIYKQAKAAFDMRLLHGNNQIYRYEKMELHHKINLPELKLKLLYRCMEICDFPNVQVILQDLFVKDNLQVISGRYIRYLYSEVVNMLVKICTNFNMDSESLLEPELITGEILDYFDHPGQIVSYIYTTVVDVFKGDKMESHDGREIVNKVREHIMKSFGEEITLKDLAKKFAINPNYLSSIFRQYTGETLMKFVTDIRVENACRLLKRSNAGISEIARTVGYEDTQYFYRVFKKARGFTPLEYRNLQS